MIRYSKETDERREGGPQECWCLHGAFGMASDWRGLAGSIAKSGISSRAVDLWRFLENGLPLTEFGKALNGDAGGDVFRGTGRSLLGYSMGGRLALHALLEKDHPWQAAVIISAHPGLENENDRVARITSDATWATRALTESWPALLAAWNAQPVFSGTPPPDPQAANRLAQHRREIARSFVDWSVGAQALLWERLPEISVPVLWIAGENDMKFRALAERAAALMPTASLAIAPGAGHRVPWEAPVWFADQVAQFLKLGRV